MSIEMSAREFEAAVGAPLQHFKHQCHAASLALVRSGVLGESRVARGTARGVGGQHSWVVLGMDCYAKDAVIVDPTLWSYRDDVTGVWSGTADVYGHRPHGAGSIWEWGQPDTGDGDPVPLLGAERLSFAAQTFLDLLGPLDMVGWIDLMNAPVGGWPSAEIVNAMADDPRLAPLIPVDRLGMLTDRNPGGLYLPAPHQGSRPNEGEKRG